MKNKNLFAVFFSVIAILMLVVSGCSQSQTGPTGGAVAKKTNEVKVGVLAALTGDVATIGISAVKAIELAAEEFNAQNPGIKIKLVIEDTKCDGAVSAAGANKLVNVDKVNVILGALCSGATVAAAPIADSNGVVMISGCSSSPAVTDAGDYIFRTSPSDTFQGAFTAEYIYNELGKKNVAIIYSNNDWGFGVQKVFKETFEKIGGNVVSAEAIEREATDLRTQLTKAVSKNPDILYTPLYSQNQGLLAKQAKELDIGIEMIGGDAAKDPNTMEVAGEAAEGLKFVAPKAFSASEFERKLKEKKGVNVELCTPFSYDAANILFEGIAKVGSDSDDIKNYLYGVEGYKGTSGEITIDENGDRAVAEFSVYQVINGDFVAIR